MPKVKLLEAARAEKLAQGDADARIRGAVAYYCAANKVKIDQFAQMVGMCPASMRAKLKKPGAFRLRELRKIAQITGDTFSEVV